MSPELGTNLETYCLGNREVAISRSGSLVRKVDDGFLF
jgi:hypothetical protein